MRCIRILLFLLSGFLWASLALRADPADVAGSHDYAGFPRLPGSIITDFDEDNPAEFDFSVARPLPIDSNHVETIHVKGHRYVIRYERNEGREPSLLETQEYYEKLASDAKFKVEKTGAIGDVTETFHKITASHEIWVCLEPSETANVLTIVESDGIVSSPKSTSVSHITNKISPVPLLPSTPVETSSPVLPAPTKPPASTPDDNSLYENLSQNGRVVFPIAFLPGKNEIDDASQPQIDQIVAMMKLHPEILLRIEGHTDNRGDSDDNLRLSAMRAYAVRDKLVAAGIDAKRLDAVGVGGLQPIADNRTAEGREKNWRIELVLRKKSAAFHVPAPNGQNYYRDAAKP
jgi:outer membrane protein OmpA-like peptidoglycan-associated protein